MTEERENLQPAKETTLPPSPLATKSSPFPACDLSETELSSPHHFPMTEKGRYSSALWVGEKVRKTHRAFDSPTKSRIVCACVQWNTIAHSYLSAETKDLFVVSNWCCRLPCLCDSWSYSENRKIPLIFITQVHHLRKERLFHLHHNLDCTSFFPLFHKFKSSESDECI